MNVMLRTPKALTKIWNPTNEIEIVLKDVLNAPGPSPNHFRELRFRRSATRFLKIIFEIIFGVIFLVRSLQRNLRRLRDRHGGLRMA